MANHSLSRRLPNIYIAIGAACWASYLINGDASGLSDDERKLADAVHGLIAMTDGRRELDLQHGALDLFDAELDQAVPIRVLFRACAVVPGLPAPR